MTTSSSIYFSKLACDYFCLCRDHHGSTVVFFCSSFRLLLSHLFHCSFVFITNEVEDPTQTENQCGYPDQSEVLWCGLLQAEKCLWTWANMRKCISTCTSEKYHLTFALYSCFLRYPMSLLADSEGPDQTTQMHSLIWAFTVHICPKPHFLMALPICRLI